MTQYLPEDSPDHIPDWMTSEVKPMNDDNPLSHSFVRRFWWLYAVCIGALLFGVATCAFGAVTAEWRVNLLRGSSTIATATGATQQEAWDNCQAQIPASATSSTTYRCQTPVYAAVVTPDPVCPPQPADETQTAQCPAGFTGSWVQTQSYGSVAPPTCWVPSGFIPTTAPEGACTAIPPPPPVLTAPTLAVPTAAPNATDPTRWNVSLSWSSVAGATSYDVERCSGATCTLFQVIKNVPTTTYLNTNIPSSQALKYRVRALDGSTKGPYSNVQAFTTPAVPTPPPPPPAGTGSILLRWTPPTQNNDGSALTNLAGYDIYWSSIASPTPTLVQAPAGVSEFNVTGLASGNYTLYLFARNSAGALSVQSETVVRAVP